MSAEGATWIHMGTERSILRLENLKTRDRREHLEEIDEWQLPQQVQRCKCARPNFLFSNVLLFYVQCLCVFFDLI